MEILLIGLGWIVTVCLLWFTVKNNERLRAMLATSDELLRAGSRDIERLREEKRILRNEADKTMNEWITCIAECDKWQVECAKLRATVERQAGDIVRLETSVKTAQRGNAVRASNR